MIGLILAQIFCLSLMALSWEKVKISYNGCKRYNGCFNENHNQYYYKVFLEGCSYK